MSSTNRGGQRSEADFYATPRDQCAVAGAKFFMKQVGANPVHSGPGWTLPYRYGAEPIKDRHGGNMREWPEDIRLRQFPTGAA